MGATFGIPLKTTSTSGGAGASDYTTTIDGSLNLYSAQVKNYPVANAFDLSGVQSEEFWGLQNITARSGQNTERQSQLSFGIAQGTGNLSKHSIVPFSRTIKNITSGNIQTGTYLEPNTNSQDFLRFGTKTAGQIDNVDNISDSISIGNRRAYVATNTNKFAVYGNGSNIISIPVDTDGIPTGTPVTTAGDVSDFAGTVKIFSVLACKGIYVWGVMLGRDGGGNSARAQTQLQLYSIDSSGNLNLVSKDTKESRLSTLGGTTRGSAYGYGSFIKNNEVFYYYSISESKVIGDSDPSYISRIIKVGKINLTTTASVDETEYYSTVDGVLGGLGGMNSQSIIGYDSVNDEILYVDSSLNIQGVDNTGTITDTGSDYYGGSYTYLPSHSADETVLSTNGSAVVTEGSTLDIFGTDAGGTRTNVYLNALFIHEIDGTNTSDDGFKGLVFSNETGKQTTSVTSSISLTLKANTVLLETKDYSNYINIGALDTNFSGISDETISDASIDFLLELSNTTGNNAKIGFGLTGGDYTTPTGNYETSTLNLLL